MTQYSISQARDHLWKLVRKARSGDSVEIIRDGRCVAVMLSPEEYDRLQEEKRLQNLVAADREEVPSDND